MIIDPKSDVPIYKQIVEQVVSGIAAGVFRPGESLPSLRALALEVRVNPNTVQRAYEELEREGIVESRRGVGMFVVESARLASHSRREQTLLTALERAVARGLKDGLTVPRIRQLFEAVLGEELQRVRSRQ